MSIKFLDELSNKNRKMFSNSVFIEAGQEIMSENDQCSSVLFLISGEIEVYKISENGKSFRLYTILPGESCVLNLSCVLSESKYMAYARATRDLECVLLPHRQFLEVFSEEEALREYVFKLIASRLIQITAKVEGIVLDTVENRLRNLLLDHKKKFVYTTHEALASQLGSAREVISRHLKKWENDGRVRLHRGKIEIIDL